MTSRDPKQGMVGRVRDLYRRRPITAWSGTAVLAGIVIAVIVILAVSGGSEPANVALNCSVSDSDGSTVLTVRGKVTQKEADEGCDGLAAKLSGEGRYWRVGLPEPPQTSPEIVCGFDAPEDEQGTAMVEVNPESLASEATTICGQLAHEGWTQFTQGGVMGPWQHEYSVALEAEEEAEAAERELAEAEAVEREERERAIYACDERAEAKEEAEIKAIEAETQERIKASSRAWEVELEIEEEGWAKEEEVQSRREAAEERCEGSEGGTEYR
jgi:hypothetical protein